MLDLSVFGISYIRMKWFLKKKKKKKRVIRMNLLGVFWETTK